MSNSNEIDESKVQSISAHFCQRLGWVAGWTGGLHRVKDFLLFSKKKENKQVTVQLKETLGKKKKKTDFSRVVQDELMNIY